MAVVFISPKQRQKVFFMGITVMLLLFLAVSFFGVFVAAPKEAPTTIVFNEPKVSIDMGVFNLDQFQQLQPLPGMKPQFSYRATNKDKSVINGFITADSVDDAKANLEGMGLTVSQIEEVVAGRDNPFIPYYQKVVPPPPAKTTKAKSASTDTNVIKK